MALQDTILSTAIAEIGTMEDNNRNVKYSSLFGKPRLDWCAMFVWWVFNSCGAMGTIWDCKTARCTTLKNKAVENGAFRSTGEKGDIAIFCWDGSGTAHHMGIVESYNSSKVTTIDGNTTESGYPNNCVARKTRSTNYVLGFIHPNYSETIITPEPTDDEEEDFTYSTDPILDYIKVLHLDLPPIETTQDLYSAVTKVLHEGYGFIDANTVSLYDDMDLTPRYNQGYYERFLEYEYKYMVVDYCSIIQAVTGIIENQWCYWLIGSDTKVGNVTSTFSPIGSGYFKIYDSYGNYIDGNHSMLLKICVDTTGMYQGGGIEGFDQPYSYQEENYIGGYNTYEETNIGGSFQYIADPPYGIAYERNIYYEELVPQTPEVRRYYEMIVLESKDTIPDPDPEEGDLDMYLNLWRNFSKRVNSTKQPVDGEQLEVKLKKNTSLLEPHLILASSVLDYNYMQIFGRFYYVKDCIALPNNMIELVGELDPLATYKDGIMATTAFVEYSATGYDEQLLDPRVSTKNSYTSVYGNIDLQYPITGSTPIDIFDGEGCYAVTVPSITSDSGVAVYIFNYTNFSKFISAISDRTNNALIDAINNHVGGNVYDSIISCKWLPINYNVVKLHLNRSEIDPIICDVVIAVHDPNEQPKGLLCSLTDKVYANVTSDLNTVFQSGTIPSDFRKSRQYMTVKYYLPMYGFININPTYLGQYLKSEFSFCTDGTVTLRLINQTTSGLSSATDYIISEITYDGSINIPIAINRSVETNVVTGVSGAVNFMSMLLGGGAVGSVVTNAISNVAGVSSGILSAQADGDAFTNGNQGGFSMARYMQPRLHIFKFDTTTVSASAIGKPVFATRSLSGLSGYCKCSQASANNIGNPQIKEQINAYMNSGFFIE